MGGQGENVFLRNQPTDMHTFAGCRTWSNRPGPASENHRRFALSSSTPNRSLGGSEICDEDHSSPATSPRPGNGGRKAWIGQSYPVSKSVTATLRDGAWERYMMASSHYMLARSYAFAARTGMGI